MTCRTFIRSFWSQSGGAAAIEFAIVAVPFLMMMMGIVEYGLFMMTKVAVESATEQAGREATIGATTPGCDATCTTINLIHTKTARLINASQLTVTAAPGTSSGAASAPSAPDVCIVPGSPPTTHTGGTCSCLGCTFVSPLGHLSYVGGVITPPSVGVSGGLVEIRVTLPWHVMFPIVGKFFGPHGVVFIQSTTLVKNEAY